MIGFENSYLEFNKPIEVEDGKIDQSMKIIEQAMTNSVK
jgi:hypothetical protein